MFLFFSVAILVYKPPNESNDAKETKESDKTDLNYEKDNCDILKNIVITEVDQKSVKE